MLFGFLETYSTNSSESYLAGIDSRKNARLIFASRVLSSSN